MNQADYEYKPYEKIARGFGWTAEHEAHHDPDSLLRNGVVHPEGYWCATWKDAVLRFQYIDGKLQHDLF